MNRKVADGTNKAGMHSQNDREISEIAVILPKMSEILSAILSCDPLFSYISPDRSAFLTSL
jgi:hypothetical protein